MYSSEYNLPVFIGTGAVLSSGSTADLKSGQLGIFNAKTYSAVSGSVASNQSMIVAGGSWHTKSKLNKFVGNLTASDKTIDFLGKDILAFERSLPRVAKAEQWVIGWDGVSATDTLSFDCGKDYHFKVRVWGEDVYGTFLRPVDRFIRVRTECCADGDCATDDCSDAVGGKKYAKLLAKAINEDPELQYFVKAEIVSSDYAAPTYTHTLFSLKVTDDGSQTALAAVQVAYPTLSVHRVSRVGLVSTYEVCTADISTVAQSPAAFQPSGTISLADCAGTCPAGYTVAYAKETFVVARPLAGSEDLVGGTAQQTYADLVKVDYFVAKTFNGATAVDPTTDQITLTAHGLAANSPLVYSNGGGTTIVGLTNGATYYVKTVVDANNIKLSATPGGAVIDITADGVGASHTLTVKSTAKFLSQNGSVAMIELVTDQAVNDIVAVKADSLTKVALAPATCVSSTPSTISWVEGDPRYKVQRTLNITLEKECGTANRLAALQAFYASEPSFVSGTLALKTAGTCNDIYEVDQWSSDCSVDNCLSEAEVRFVEPQSFEGFEWAEEPAAAGSTTVKTGVRITTAYEDTRFGGCSFNPADYYSVRPLKVEIHEFDDSGLPCHTPVPSRRIRNASMATQSGQWVVRKFIESNKYRAFGEFYLDPRLKEALDANIHQVVDTDKFYKLYFLKVRQNRLYQNHNADYSPEIFEFMFAFPENVDTSSFELAFEKVTSQFGISLQDR